jgi:DNA uptake protein ComE-like DNA-binding protein
MILDKQALARCLVLSLSIAGLSAMDLSEARAQAGADETFLGQTRVEQGEAQIQQEITVTETRIVEREIPTLIMQTEVADINRMESEHFEAIGFSEEIAQAIVAHRNEYGPYRSAEELQEVEGVDEILVNRLSKRLGAFLAE